MADSKAFEIACEELEAATTLSGLESRGTIRIALKQSGLDAGLVSATEMDVVLRAVLPKELGLRSVDEPETVCETIASALKAADLGDEQRSDSPEAVFSRLAG